MAMTTKRKTKPKHYWAAYTKRGAMVFLDTGLPCLFRDKFSAKFYSERVKGRTIRKVYVVEAV